MPRLAGEREHERRRARARRGARVLEPAARELVGEGAQAEVGVRGWHRLGGHARRPPPAPRLHADRRELGRGAAGAGRTLPRARARPGGGAVGGRARPPRGARARRSTCSPATRWAAGSRSRSRCGAPSTVRALVLVSASPGLADAEERAARRAADDALADRIEAIGAEAFAREWAAQPLFAGQPAAVAALAHEDRLRRSAAEHAAQLRGLGTGVDAAAVGPPGRARAAGDARGRRARREVPRDRRADGASGCRTPRSSWWRAPATPSRSRLRRRSRRRSPARTRRCPESLAVARARE